MENIYPYLDYVDGKYFIFFAPDYSLEVIEKPEGYFVFYKDMFYKLRNMNILFAKHMVTVVNDALNNGGIN